MATGRYLLIAFSSKTKIQISNRISVSKAGSAQVPIEVSLACGRRLPRICVPAPVLQRRCPAPLAFCARSWRGIQIQTADAVFKVHSMKNCRPVVRLQILSENKENRPAGDQKILSGTSGGKMVRCGCGTVVYHSEVAYMG